MVHQTRIPNYSTRTGYWFVDILGRSKICSQNRSEETLTAASLTVPAVNGTERNPIIETILIAQSTSEVIDLFDNAVGNNSNRLAS